MNPILAEIDAVFIELEQIRLLLADFAVWVAERDDVKRSPEFQKSLAELQAKIDRLVICEPCDSE